MTRMNFLKNKQNAIFSVASCALIMGIAIFFSSQIKAADDKKAAPARAALTVTTVQPVQSSLPLKLPANGTVVAWQEAIIGSEANGLRLVDVKVNVGDRVTKGQVLATFATEQINAEVAQARASVLEAQANALDAAGNADKARTLQASGALSEQQINQYNTADKTAKARLEAAKAILAVQQVKLRQTGVVAPDSGVISSRSATVGAVVGSGTELFKMIRGGRLEWRAEVTSSEMAGIKLGAMALVTAASGAQVQGKVRMIAPTVDSVTRNALVYVDLPANANIKAGMYARGEFELGSSSVLSLPQQALVLRDGFTYAMRLEPGNKISQIKLQTGRRVGDAVEIIKGAKTGEQFVASGAAFLADGDLVKVVAVQPPNASASATSPAVSPKASK